MAQLFSFASLVEILTYCDRWYSSATF